jgi:hypothetical protein
MLSGGLVNNLDINIIQKCNYKVEDLLNYNFLCLLLRKNTL